MADTYSKPDINPELHVHSLAAALMSNLPPLSNLPDMVNLLPSLPGTPGKSLSTKYNFTRDYHEGRMHTTCLGCIHTYLQLKKGWYLKSIYFTRHSEYVTLSALMTGNRMPM